MIMAGCSSGSVRCPQPCGAPLTSRWTGAALDRRAESASRRQARKSRSAPNRPSARPAVAAANRSGPRIDVTASMARPVSSTRNAGSGRGRRCADVQRGRAAGLPARPGPGRRRRQPSTVQHAAAAVEHVARGSTRLARRRGPPATCTSSASTAASVAAVVALQTTHDREPGEGEEHRRPVAERSGEVERALGRRCRRRTGRSRAGAPSRGGRAARR